MRLRHRPRPVDNREDTGVCLAVRVVLIILRPCSSISFHWCAVGAYATPCAAQEAADTTESGGKELRRW